MSSSQCLRRAAMGSLSRPASRCPTSFITCSRAAQTARGLRSLSSLSASRRPANLITSSERHSQTPAITLILQQTRHYAEKIVQVPSMAESISEGTLKQFSKKVGDYVEQDEEIATIETDKIDVAVNAPEAGTIKEFLANEDDTVTVGQDLVKLETGGAPSDGGKVESKSEPKAAASDKQETSSQPDGSKEQEKSGAKEEKQPAPKKEESKQEEQIKPEPQPSGQPQTQSTEQKSAPKPAAKPASKPALKTEEKADQGPFGGNRTENRVKMNRMRLRIAERLKQSQNTAASLTTFNEVDMSALMDFRKRYKEEVLKKTGVKLGFMSAFTRACCLAMKEVPSVNASIEGPGAGDTIVYRDYVDVSVAVATEKGLVTPVVRNAESMDLVGIEKAIAELGKKARDNKLTIEDMAGGSFTISNGGVFGSLYGTPIINLPQTAVLGLHAIKDKPVAINGKVEIRPMMYLALTYDHRLCDGREAVTFLVRIKEYIEDPSKMLLGF